MFRSIAIIPSAAVISQVQYYKQSLARKIGWYPSSNADAHITVNTFISDSWRHEAWLKKLEHFCSVRTPFVIRFDSVKLFRPTRTLYLAPDKQSIETLKYLMSDFHGYTKDLKATRTYEPHMTIARSLKPEDLEKAMAHFERCKVNLVTDCDALYVRKLNEARGQYQVESRHFFEGNYLPSVHHPKPLYLF